MLRAWGALLVDRSVGQVCDVYIYTPRMSCVIGCASTDEVREIMNCSRLSGPHIGNRKSQLHRAPFDRGGRRILVFAAINQALSQ